MSLAAWIKGTGNSGFGYGSTAEKVTEGLDLSGKRFLVTGCNSGLGLETMRVLTMRGAKVLGAARTIGKAEAAAAEVAPDAIPVACELSEPSSVLAAVDVVQATGTKLDGIICNAGIMALPELEVQHGYEAQFFTNHIGHFLLVTRLMDWLTDDARVVIVSSSAHKAAPKPGIEFDNLDGSKSYSPWKAYGQSKLANILFANELSRRLGPGQTANSLHPGVIATNLGRHLPGVAHTVFGVLKPLFLKTIPQGSATQVYVATHPTLSDVTG